MIGFVLQTKTIFQTVASLCFLLNAMKQPAQPQKHFRGYKLVQIMRFSCCLNIAFTWQSLSRPWSVCLTLHRKALRPWLIKCFCSMTLWRRYDVRKFDADTILFREILCKKRDILIFKQGFQSALGWNHVKYARITITHVCFIALTLVRSLRWCLNTRPNGLMFKQLPRDPANVNAWKYSKQQRCSLAPRL